MSAFPGDDPDLQEIPKKAARSGRGPLIGALVGAAVAIALFGFLLPAVSAAREAARRSQCVCNLKQIMLALVNYADSEGALPPAYTVDANGRRLHSWRTLILPYLEQRSLYESIDLSKPWDDPANAKAFATPVLVYSCPSTTHPPTNATVYRASVGPHAYLLPTEPRPISTITDGTASTLAIVEVALDAAVPWMSPEDADEAMILRPGPGSPLQHEGGLNAGLADGSIRFLKATTSPEVRRALISVDGGETIQPIDGVDTIKPVDDGQMLKPEDW